MKTLSNLNSLISSPLTLVLDPGQNFTVTFHTVDYIQNNLQFYSVFGVAPYPGFGESFLGTPVPVVAPHPGADGSKQGGVDLLVGLNSHLGKFNVTLSKLNVRSLPSALCYIIRFIPYCLFGFISIASSILCSRFSHK